MLEHAAIFLGCLLALGLLLISVARLRKSGWPPYAGSDPHAWEDGDLEPTTQREAQAWGYCGARCPHCKSLRLMEVDGSYSCWSCGEVTTNRS